MDGTNGEDPNLLTHEKEEMGISSNDGENKDAISEKEKIKEDSGDKNDVTNDVEQTSTDSGQAPSDISFEHHEESCVKEVKETEHGDGVKDEIPSATDTSKDVGGSDENHQVGTAAVANQDEPSADVETTSPEGDCEPHKSAIDEKPCKADETSNPDSEDAKPKLESSPDDEDDDKKDIKPQVETREFGTDTNDDTDSKPSSASVGVLAKSEICPETTQTDKVDPPTLVPLACPQFIPVPLRMYNAPFPVPVPMPLALPIPIFLPTRRNSIRGIRKQIRRLRTKLPAGPLRLKLTELAGILLTKDGKEDLLDSDDSSDGGESDFLAEEEEERLAAAARGPEVIAPPPDDLEKDIEAMRIVPKPLPLITPDPILSPGPHELRGIASVAGMKRRLSQAGEEDKDAPSWPQVRPVVPRGGGRSRNTGATSNRGAKQGRRDLTSVAALQGRSATIVPAVSQMPKERPDAKHHLKFTYGVNAWKHWVVQKNAELEKARAQGKYMKTFETDILKLRADELIYTLCMFVKEVRKPNGEPYSPDSMLYLTLGIQEYLIENGRIDNIFTDMYYEPFTNALHDVVKDFKLPVNELGFFITRIEEEHLWESKQLGAHSPQVLLNTLIYFNTKYFLLKTAEQHRKLSFSHIMKHWKKATPNTPPLHKVGLAQPMMQQKTILLRYYPPPSKGKNKVDERRCLEQQENTSTPLRCPVKLYEFYLSKCPESTKTRNDLFYLQPERSCVPDSPVWYSSNPLNGHQLDKMLQRLLMIKEVQEHMIADAC